MIKAIIFDADDTLYATHDAAKKAEISSMKFFANQKNVNPQMMYSEFLEIVKKASKSKNPLHRHRRHSYRILAKKHKLKGIEKAYKIFFDEVIRQIKIIPDVKYALKHLAKYKLAIVSQDFREQITKKLKNFKLAKHFDVVITCDDVRVMKPNRKYYQAVFKKLRVKPDECVVIGDDYERDLRIPASLGCITIMYGFDKGADYSFLDYKLLPKMINEINKAKTI